MSQHKLLQLIDQAKPNLQPLNIHYMAQFSVAERQDYATMLAAVITGTGTVTEAQSRLFGMLLTSMELDDNIASYYKLAQELDFKTLVLIIEGFARKEVSNSLIFDMLVISVLCDFDSDLLNSEIVTVLEVRDLIKVKKYIGYLFGNYERFENEKEKINVFILNKEQFLFRLKSKIQNSQYKALDRDIFKYNKIDFIHDGKKVKISFDDYRVSKSNNAKFKVNIEACNKASFNINGLYDFLLDCHIEQKVINKNITVPIEFSAWSEFFKDLEVKK
ncbi:TPA: hypothetical protein ACX6RB_000846 [Photobacterium damselae]